MQFHVKDGTVRRCADRTIDTSQRDVHVDVMVCSRPSTSSARPTVRRRAGSFVKGLRKTSRHLEHKVSVLAILATEVAISECCLSSETNAGAFTLRTRLDRRCWC